MARSFFDTRCHELASRRSGSLTIVSGGQTGVDRAALRSAIRWDLPVEGWCPQGRRAEDGTIPREFPLRETPSKQFGQRTEWNVRDSDATLIVDFSEVEGTNNSPGTLWTVQMANWHGRPWRTVTVVPGQRVDVGGVIDWLTAHRVQRLNIAGPRESEVPGAEDVATREMFDPLFRKLSDRSVNAH